MNTRIPGFKGEYLWELEIAERQLLALAEAFPQESYAWRPADTARSVAQVLVHVAVGSLMLLELAGVRQATDLYGAIPGEGSQRMSAMIAKNEDLEASMTSKTDILALLKRSLEAVRDTFTSSTDQELNRVTKLFGEDTAVRRTYMRLLAHMHEHMGQLIAYTRAMGQPAPWPNWREAGKKITERNLA